MKLLEAMLCQKNINDALEKRCVQVEGIRGAQFECTALGAKFGCKVSGIAQYSF